jgi:D-glycero-D-manno-heptose 1,7-bisphosphate phosphatase
MAAEVGARLVKRCVFFDRDGIVNVSPPEGDYVRSWRDFELAPGFPALLRLAGERGYVGVVITNQRGVARGLMTESDLADIHRRLRELLRAGHGLELLDILHCPHGRDECECRKPKPGMLLEAAHRHALDLAQSWMIGDSERDVEAGRRAGCRTVLVGGDPAADSCADFRVPDLDAAERLFREQLG